MVELNRLDRQLERTRRRFTRVEARIDQYRERFLKRFGRPPGPQDSSFIKAMVRAGADAESIYAFWKTGIVIVTPFGGDHLSPDQSDIWDAAICEYMDLTGDGSKATRLM